MSPLSPRPYVIEEYTRTVCPECFAERPRRSDDPETFVDGMLVSRDGALWMWRYCPIHGESESLYEEDLEIWRARFGWATPTLAMNPDRSTGSSGFPAAYAEGLPASHGQHTCILLLNATQRCNYACPTCFASALAPGQTPPEGDRPSIEELLHTVDTTIAREGGRLSVVMVSGGEPTVRKDIEELLERLLERNVTRILLNTNGRRISRDDRFLRFLVKNRDRIEVYLQFDGFRPETYLALRGEDVSEEKCRTLERLGEARVFSTLVAAVAKGVNDAELGDILALALSRPRVAGVMFQPVFGSGRHSGIDGRDRLTPTGTIRRLEAQSQGQVRADDFVPLPCSHKDCCDITYLLKDRDDRWTSLPRLIGREELKNWIHLVANSIAFESASDAVKEMLRSGAIQRVFSEQQKVGAPQLAMDVFNMCGCVPGVAEALGSLYARLRGPKMLEKIAERTLRVTVKMFMDAHTFHEHRIRQCCVHVGTFEDDPRRYSFCWRWLFADASDFPSRGLIPLTMARRQP